MYVILCEWQTWLMIGAPGRPTNVIHTPASLCLSVCLSVCLPASFRLLSSVRSTTMYLHINNIKRCMYVSESDLYFTLPWHYIYVHTYIHTYSRLCHVMPDIHPMKLKLDHSLIAIRNLAGHHASLSTSYGMGPMPYSCCLGSSFCANISKLLFRLVKPVPEENSLQLRISM